MRPKVSLKRVGQMLDLLDQMEDPPALMVYGPPGIGKTTVLKRFAEERGHELRVKHLSRMDTTDWSGIPRTGADLDYTEFLPINLFRPAQRKETKIVLFFDELNTALPQVLNAALDVILEKKGDGERARLPKNTIIVAAGNLGEEDGTYVEELSAAVKTRMIQVEFSTEHARVEWLHWAKGAALAQEVVGYVEAHRELEVLLDLPGFKKNEQQVATPRGWERVSEYVKTLDRRGRAEGARSWRDDPGEWGMFSDLVKGTVGHERGGDFLKWLQAHRAASPDPATWRERCRRCAFLGDATADLGNLGAIAEAFRCAEEGLSHLHEGATDFAEKVLATADRRRRSGTFTRNEGAAVRPTSYPKLRERMIAGYPDLAAWFAKVD